MSRFRKKLIRSEKIGFKCKTPFTSDVVDRKANYILEFSDQLRLSHTLEIEVLLKFIRTYGKKAKPKPASEWKNEYEISFIQDDSTEPIVFQDIYKLVDNEGTSPHSIFLSNVTVGKLNLNGQIDISTHIMKDEGEYLIDIDLQVDYQNWYE